MLVNILFFLDAPYYRFQAIQLHRPVNLGDCGVVRGLHADLQLDQSRPHLTDQRNLLIRQKIGRYLKMEVGHAIIMFD